MKYIKKFETEEEYNSYINGEGGGAVYLPNVSLIEEVGHCSFNPSRWNQLIQNGNFIENINGWSAYNGGNLTVSHTANTLLATARTDGTGYSWGAKCTTSPFVTEHKYYIAFSVKSSVAAKYSAEAANRGIANVSIRANIWTRINGIITASLPNSPFIIKPQTAISVNDTYEIRNVILVNLTALYGKGNEPTVAEFEAQYPEDYYPYCPL